MGRVIRKVRVILMARLLLKGLAILMDPVGHLALLLHLGLEVPVRLMAPLFRLDLRYRKVRPHHLVQVILVRLKDLLFLTGQEVRNLLVIHLCPVIRYLRQFH
jgi:hypothetical protein